jgi:hypothetical protein
MTGDINRHALVKSTRDNITKAEVDAAIRKYFDLSKAVTVVVGTK